MVCTFQKMTLKKYLTTNFEKNYRGTSILPLEVRRRQNWPAQLYLWPHFSIPESIYARKMWMFAKKLKLNPLRFDGEIRVLSSIKNILKIFDFFALWTKNAVNQRVFKIFSKKKFYLVNNYPFILHVVQKLILEAIKKPPKAKI